MDGPGRRLGTGAHDIHNAVIVQVEDVEDIRGSDDGAVPHQRAVPPVGDDLARIDREDLIRSVAIHVLHAGEAEAAAQGVAPYLLDLGQGTSEV